MLEMVPKPGVLDADLEMVKRTQRGLVWLDLRKMAPEPETVPEPEMELRQVAFEAHLEMVKTMQPGSV